MSEVDVEEVGDEPVVEQVEPTVDPNVEAEARRMGWRPQEEFSGNGEWRGAEEFVERGKEINGILRKDKERSDARVTELEATVAATADYLKKADDRAYKKAMADIQQKQREAVDEMDTAKFDAAAKELTDLEPPMQQPTAPTLDPVFDSWKKDNIWYDDNVEMGAYADSIAARVSAKMGNAVGRGHMDEVSREVRKKFPDHFENPRRQAAPSVEGGAVAPKSKADPHSYANIPAADKTQFNRFVKEGVYEDTDAARKEYAEIYFEDDV